MPPARSFPACGLPSAAATIDLFTVQDKDSYVGGFRRHPFLYCPAEVFPPFRFYRHLGIAQKFPNSVSLLASPSPATFLILGQSGILSLPLLPVALIGLPFPSLLYASGDYGLSMSPPLRSCPINYSPLPFSILVSIGPLMAAGS